MEKRKGKNKDFYDFVNFNIIVIVFILIEKMEDLIKYVRELLFGYFIE